MTAGTSVRGMWVVYPQNRLRILGKQVSLLGGIWDGWELNGLKFSSEQNPSILLRWGLPGPWDGHRLWRTNQGQGLLGRGLLPDPPFPSQPGSPRLGGGRHILKCDLLLHLGMARCHVPSSWQTAVKESSTWFPCLSRGRDAISKGGTAAPILPFPTWQVVQRQFSNSQTSVPLWIWLIHPSP